MGILRSVVLEKMSLYEPALWGELGVVVTHLDGCYASITLKAKLSFHHIFTSIIMNYIWNDDTECVLRPFDIKLFKFTNCLQMQ